ncbi:WYL domain-containing protein [Glaciihabitans sp. UYNi722]|uniref:helix-turn-helix transcriptional regulator n=1 Tax=Glaciihabitans sp. UYNi722 TaxID=3156344 RepID=UPI00339770D3
MSAASSAKIPVEERLFSLVLALLATETGLTKNEVLSTVQGYRQRFNAGGDNANLERQFERDKDDIRDLGVPLETIESPGQAGNNQNLRYRIPRGTYELPSDITFSAEETTLLNLAAMVWREGSLSAESRRAVMKLKGLGLVSDEPVLGYAPRLRVRDAAFEPLRLALEKNAVVRFAYLKPGEAEGRIRTVAPLALVQHQGRWHLHAEEPDTAVTKTFLLRRIVSQITLTGATFHAPSGDQTGRALRELEEVWNAHTADVEVMADSDAATRLHKRRGTVTLPSGALRLHYSDANIFADELAGYGPEVLVLSPPVLRAAVRSRLLRTVADHTDRPDLINQEVSNG